MIVEMMEEVWNRRNLAAMRDYFDRDVILSTVGDHRCVPGLSGGSAHLVSPFPAPSRSGIFRRITACATADCVAVTWKPPRVQGHRSLRAATVSRRDTGISQFQIVDGKVVRDTCL